MRTREEVMFAFTPVGKVSQKQQMCLMKIETAFKDLASEILDLVPESADRTSALRKCLEAKMMCSQAISHDVNELEQTKEAPAQQPKAQGKNGKQSS